MNVKMVIAAVVALIGLWLTGLCMARLNDIGNNGTIIMPGYEHAVGFCGVAGRADELLIINTEGSIFTGRNYFLVINAGHENDKELQNLKALTLIECN
jgi:hypothetical protein